MHSQRQSSMARQGWILELREEAWGHLDFSASVEHRRKTALGVLIAFTLAGIFAGALVWFREGAFGGNRAITFCLIGLTLAVALVLPLIGRPVYCLLTGIAGSIGFLINVVLLGVMYYFIITPAAIVARLLAKDFLDRRTPRRQSDSSWHEHRGAASKRQYHHLS